ncbi:hypothetical protein BJ138DRAFT_913896 [Hygrophoropsis aurantiaca]|uniref:Uncharacterized protein n=1 Tax=Hygrophoropsis aurantiaca TaxID=72124 RepID=A0ACB8AEZ8_9AGAM|nr:hypothetical protein BJ138DRAFT_913896 [Hygrophoropsis aurantiaca]
MTALLLSVLLLTTKPARFTSTKPGSLGLSIALPGAVKLLLARHKEYVVHDVRRNTKCKVIGVCWRRAYAYVTCCNYVHHITIEDTQRSKAEIPSAHRSTGTHSFSFRAMATQFR